MWVVQLLLFYNIRFININVDFVVCYFAAKDQNLYGFIRYVGILLLLISGYWLNITWLHLRGGLPGFHINITRNKLSASYSVKDTTNAKKILSCLC